MAGKKKTRGFTVVEMLVSMLAFSILVLSIGLMLVYSWRGWRYSNESITMQRDASLAFKVITREIRGSSITNMTFSADQIGFTAAGVRASTGAESIYRTEGGDLVHQGSSGDFVLLDGTASRFQSIPSISNGLACVEVTLEYQTESGEDSGMQKFTVYTRN